MEDKSEEIAESCIEDFRKVVASPLYYTEYNEDGSISYSKTNLGEQLYDIIVKNCEKHLKNA